MLKVEFTDEEREILNQILLSALTTLEVELHRTDDLRYKERLEHRSDVLQRLMAKVMQPVPGAA
ncbi:MAG: hypothetical protein JWQ04_1846 [Pedosphaera sp.]|nr:hypothetical protein [Pedosphaera sp.]